MSSRSSAKRFATCRSQTRSVAVTSAVAAFALVASVGFGISNGGCANVDTERVTDVVGPSSVDFTGKKVSQFLEVRCGSLDCHGQLGRPMRIFSGNGLRLENDAGLVSGLGATSLHELRENYYAVVGLEPESMRRVVEEQGLAPERLLLVTKARNEVVHKGGAVVSPQDDGDRCMTSWLAGATEQAACERAATLGQ